MSTIFKAEQNQKNEYSSQIVFTDETLIRDSIAEVLLKDDIDFVVCYVISPWHAIGVDVLASGIMQRNDQKPSGIIAIAAHTKDGFLVHEKDFVCPSFAKTRFFYLDIRGQLSGTSIFQRYIKLLRILLGIRAIKKSKDNRRILHIASIVHPNIDILQLFTNRRIADKYRPVFSLLDEGIGSYMSSDVWKLIFRMHANKRQQGISVFKRFLLPALVRVENVVDAMVLRPIVMTCMYGCKVRNLNEAARKYIPTETLFVFHEVEGRLVPDKQIADYYREVIERRAARHGKIEKGQNLVMLLTQPFSEYNQVSAEAELGIVERVVDIAVDRGFEVVLKPHPRENPDKYLQLATKFGHMKVRISEHSVPAEELFPIMHPVCVIGYTSTALPIASAVYNIPAITILDLLLDNTQDEYIKLHGSEFKKLTTDIVQRADSFDKLGEILSTVASGDAAIQ